MTIFKRSIVISFLAGLPGLACQATAHKGASELREAANPSSAGSSDANAQVCDALPTGKFKSVEDNKVRAKVTLTRTSANNYAIDVTKADQYSGFRPGKYVLKTSPTAAGSLEPCDIQIFDQQGVEIVPLSNPILPMGSPFHADLSVTASGSIFFESSGFSGCGGEGTTGNCPPAEAELFKQ